MNDARSKSTTSPWPARVTMFFVAVIAGTCVGVASGAIQQTGFAPVGVLSLAVGAVLGFVLVGAGGLLNLPKPGWGSVALAAAVTVASQHVWLYRAVMAAREQAARAQPAVELFKPGWTEVSMWSYLQTQATLTTILLWLLDACLLGIATAIILNWSKRKGERGA